MSRRILIVEDEAPIREMLSFVMEQHGYQAVEAHDFDAAVSKIAEPYPDMVLLDWMLPGGSGIQLAKKIKGDDFTRQHTYYYVDRSRRRRRQNKRPGSRR